MWEKNEDKTVEKAVFGGREETWLRKKVFECLNRWRKKVMKLLVVLVDTTLQVFFFLLLW